jgi:hypothetical protein
MGATLWPRPEFSLEWVMVGEEFLGLETLCENLRDYMTRARGA